MATIDEIAKDLENLKKKLEEDVERLQEDIKSRKEEILNLEKALSSIQEINNREIFRYTVIPICHYDSPDTQGGSGGRQWTHPCGDSNLINNYNYSVEGPYFFGLKQ